MIMARKGGAGVMGRMSGLSALGSVLLAVVFFAQNALADDTEIYKPSYATVPYVMLLVDTSGSMSGAISDEDSSQRMATMKNALHTMLSPENSSDDYHIGLARYTSPGGAILYPIKRLGDPASVTTTYYGAGPEDDFRLSPDFVSDDRVLSVSSDDGTVLGVRISNVGIPRGAHIDSAALVFTNNGNFSGSVQLGVKIAQQSNTPQIANQTEFDGLPWSSEKASSPIVSGAQLDSQMAVTIDVSTMLAARVLASDWAAENALAFRVTADTGTIGFYSTESATEAAGNTGRLLRQFRPRLYVKYHTDETTVRDALKAVVEELPTIGDTPLIGSYYEVAHYMLGKAAHFGLARGSQNWRLAMRVSNLSSMIGPVSESRDAMCVDAALDSRACMSQQISGTPIYDAPALSDCSVSPAIVMLTDGEPNNERCTAGDPTDRCDLKVIKDELESVTAGSASPLSCDDSSNWDCGIQLSRYMADPQKHSPPGASVAPAIPTYTIGFGQDTSVAKIKLTALARGGDVGNELESSKGGLFFDAQSGGQLASNFAAIMGLIRSGVITQASAGTSISQSNRTQNSDELYFALFEPTRNVLWPGNLKRYRAVLRESGGRAYDIVGQPDSDGKPVVAVENGVFVRNSRSYWSKADDGDSVTSGGALSQIPTDRRIFSFLDDYPQTPNSSAKQLNSLTEDLFASAALNDTLKSLLGAATDDESKNIVRWLRRNYDNQSAIMGASLHATPLLVNYGYRDDAHKEPINTIFLPTNQGLLHAFNADEKSGKELYAFLPKELLANQKKFKVPVGDPDKPESFESNTGPMLYGLDNSWVAYRYDANRNGVYTDAGDAVYLYGGMRMGGRNYYALDVSKSYSTDTSNNLVDDPLLKFVITPDTKAGEAKPFEKMGMTWSVPTLYKLANDCSASQPKEACGTQMVMAFGGGYDETSHEKTSDVMPTNPKDSKGAALYLVDAKTGQYLSHSSGSDGSGDPTLAGMDFSVTARISAFDTDSDGFVDSLYAVDLGGQVMRFDLAKNAHNQSIAKIEKAYILAKLGGTAAGAALPREFRRFYDAPAIVQMRDATDGKKWIAIAVGSGYRSHPNDSETAEALFVIRDYQVFDHDSDVSVIRVADLSDATPAPLTVENKKGWYYLLGKNGASLTGEKSIGESFALDGNVYFSSYIPPVKKITACNIVEIGNMNIYGLSLRTAEGVLPKLDDAGNPSPDGYSLRVIPTGVSQFSGGTAYSYIQDEKHATAALSSATENFKLKPTSKNIVRTRWRTNANEVRVNNP